MSRKALKLLSPQTSETAEKSASFRNLYQMSLGMLSEAGRLSVNFNPTEVVDNLSCLITSAHFFQHRKSSQKRWGLDGLHSASLRSWQHSWKHLGSRGLPAGLRPRASLERPYRCWRVIVVCDFFLSGGCAGFLNRALFFGCLDGLA